MADPLFLLLDEVRQGVHRTEARLDDVAQTLAENTSSLKEHVRRTNELEKFTKEIEKRVRPLEAHQHRLNGALKLFTVVSSVCGGIFAVLRLMRII